MRPAVLGYLRTTVDDGRFDAVAYTRQLLAHADLEGLTLSTVFIDTDLDRLEPLPALAALLDVLPDHEAHGVLVPALTHLSAHPARQIELLSCIEHAGAHVYTVEQPRCDPANI